MAKKSNPALIGTFVVGAVVLIVAALLLFGSGRFFSDRLNFVLFFDGSIKGLSVGSLYEAKKKLRVHGIVAPHGKRAAATATSRKSQPPRFIEAVRRTDVPDGAISWRVRFPDGELLESTRRLSFDETLRLIETLKGRA